MKPCLWTGMYAEFPLWQALEIGADCGFSVFEVSTEHLDALLFNSRQAAEVAMAIKVAKDRSLHMAQAHGFLGADVAHGDPEKQHQDIEHVKSHIDLAHELDVSVIVLHPGGRSRNGESPEQIVQANVDPFRKIAAYAADRKMSIAIENMMWAPFTTPEELQGLVQAIDHPAIGITLDTSHAHVVGIPAGDFARGVASKLLATHISDNDGSGDQHRMPGSGTIDWELVMNALRGGGFDGPLNFEIPGERHPSLALKNGKTRYAFDTARVLIDEL